MHELDVHLRWQPSRLKTFLKYVFEPFYVFSCRLDGPEFRKQVEHVRYACSATEAAASAGMFDPSEFKAKRQVEINLHILVYLLFIQN